MKKIIAGLALLCGMFLSMNTLADPPKPPYEFILFAKQQVIVDYGGVKPGFTGTVYYKMGDWVQPVNGMTMDETTYFILKSDQFGFFQKIRKDHFYACGGNQECLDKLIKKALAGGSDC